MTCRASVCGRPHPADTIIARQRHKIQNFEKNRTYIKYNGLLRMPTNFYETQDELIIGCSCMMVRPSVRPSEEFTHTQTHLHISPSLLQIIKHLYTKSQKMFKISKIDVKKLYLNFFSKSQKMFKISKIYVKRLYLKFFSKSQKNVQNFKKLC